MKRSSEQSRTISISNTKTKDSGISESEQISALGESGDAYSHLYPSTLDPNFNAKIANKKEFYDSRYELDVQPVEEQSEKICTGDFEIAPHQAFVRNFLSFLTPYNSLLLFHGLGTGKTCSSISVCEEMREYMKQTGTSKKIIVIASPNVQSNFKLQLFDERKLELVNGIWNLRACTGNRLLKEINPMNMKGLSKEKVVRQIEQLIKQYYLFMGYTQFSNVIDKIKEKYSSIESTSKRRKAIDQHIRREFSNRMIVIDEVHNIRIANDSKSKPVADNLLRIVTNSSNTKLLLLSATPMFNSYKEIIFLLNLLNLNDKRPPIDGRMIFDKDGNFKTDQSGREVGKEYFIQKINGYISFVQGEDPYSFPYRVFPQLFDNTHSSVVTPNNNRIQVDDTPIIEPMRHTDCYLVQLGEYQKRAYDYMMREIKTDLTTSEIDTKLGWSMMDKPLQVLNIAYPNVSFDKVIRDEDVPDFEINDMVGKNGLTQVVNYNTKTKRGFSYKEGVIERYGRVFHPGQIEKYSGKLHQVSQSLLNSKGVVLIYTQFIDGGCLPIALMLEEMGITRYGSTKNLFEKPPTKSIDALTMKPINETNKDKASPAKYVIISGDNALSPRNNSEINASTNLTNVYGKDVKVILITRAGSEGIDFKYIRQIHIMEPWYNNNRNEQTIGRAVRFKSHCALPLDERNVEIYLYGTRTTSEENEPVDMYIYRRAEYKSIQIGKISRVIKENAVDCIMNRGNTQLSVDVMNQTIPIVTSTNKKLDYDIGNKPYSSGCDYMEDCNYKCSIESEEYDESAFGKNMATYNERFIVLNVEKLMNRIKDLFKERYSYSKQEIITRLQMKREYPLIQIDSALTQLLEDKTEFLVDMYDNLGHLVNIGDYYLYQPLEYSESHNISLYNRSNPVDYKPKMLELQVKKDISKYTRTDAKPNVTLESLDENKGKTVYNRIKSIVDSIEPLTMDDMEEGDYTSEQKVLNYLCYLLLRVDKKNVTKDLFNNIVMNMSIDKLLYNDKLNLLEFVIGSDDSSVFMKNVYEYLHKILYYGSDRSGGAKKSGIYVLYTDSGQMKVFSQTSSRTLEKATKTAIEKGFESIEREKLSTEDFIKTFNKKFSFVSDFETGSSVIMVYRIKEYSSRQDRGGSRCDTTPMPKLKTYLQEFLDERIYDSLVLNKDKIISYQSSKKSGLVKDQLCMLLELYARINDVQMKNGKRWYFNYEFGMMNSIKLKKG